MIVEFIKKYRLTISLIAGFIALYGLSVYFLFENYIGKPILEVNILTDASLWQFITSLLYTAFFFLLWHTGKKKGNELMLKLASIQSAIMFILPIVCIFFLIFGFDTELGKLIFSYILLITMIPFTGFGINVYAVFIIPVIGIVLFILSRKELKKLN